jgi:hypothetical protein
MWWSTWTGVGTEGGTSTTLQTGLAAMHARAERQFRSTCTGLFGSGDASEFGILGGHRSSIKSSSNIQAGHRALWSVLRSEFHGSGIFQVLQGLCISVDFSLNYRQVHGNVEKRLVHGAGHVFVAHRFDGTPMANYSKWLRTASAVALSNAYHPGNKRAWAPHGAA